MKKSSKIILLAALSYIIAEEPELCNKFLKILEDCASKKKRKDL